MPTRPRARRAGQRTGFTFVELLIALSLAVVLAAAGTPVLSDLIVRHRLVAVARNLGVDLAGARHEAARRGVPLHLVSRPGGKRWCYGLALHPMADCRGTPESDRALVSVVHGEDHPGVLLLQAPALVIDVVPPTVLQRAPPVRLGQARGAQALVQLSPMGRAHSCALGGYLPGLAPCPPDTPQQDGPPPPG